MTIPLTTIDWLLLQLEKQLHTPAHRIVSSKIVKILQTLEVSMDKLQNRLKARNLMTISLNQNAK
ncbi:MAG: hypothetical protein Q8L97_06100 [Nitrosomonas sp.]|uniref:hypothetical protein n=1 Tax=Nitrosomonas sp. TaxID=42353 RepID=UPI0027322977|nr:hypothetical protein [Nitrosomonas sp.]MDP1549717.1 hypothetical protein [Nitrosomonas sp.]